MATPMTKTEASFYLSLTDPEVSLVYCPKHPGQAVRLTFYNPGTRTREPHWYCPRCGTQLKETDRG